MRLARVLSGLLGSFLVIYWVGGTIGNAAAGQFHWQTLPYPLAGVLLGCMLIGFAAWGHRPAARRILLRALAAGALTALVGTVPALLLLGTFMGGVAPHMITAIVAIPLLFVAGAISGAAFTYMKQREVAPLTATPGETSLGDAHLQ